MPTNQQMSMAILLCRALTKPTCSDSEDLWCALQDSYIEGRSCSATRYGTCKASNASTNDRDAKAAVMLFQSRHFGHNVFPAFQRARKE